MAELPETLYGARAKAKKEEESQTRLAAQGAPFSATILTVNAQADRFRIQHLDGPVESNILHPYLGLTAWHRVGPEPGMEVLAQSRVDSGEPESFVYFAPKNRERPGSRRIENFENDKEAFRPIEQGEQELSSRGLAQIYMGRRPVLEVRAGVIRSWWDQDRLEHGSKAVIHRLLMSSHQSNAIGDELRLGAVSRPGVAQQGGKDKSRINTIFPKAGSGYAKEFMYSLAGNTTTPGVLVDHREGNVIEDSGAEATGGPEGSKLRYRKLLFNTSGQSTNVAVDDKGNAGIQFPRAAQTGLKLEIQQGKFEASVGRSVRWSAETTYDVTSKQDLTLSSDRTSKLLGTEVRLGANTANEPLILGGVYRDAEIQMCETLSAMERSSAQALTTALSTLNSLSGTLQSTNALPIVPGAVFANVVQAVVTALTGCFTAQSQAATQKATATSSFKSGYSSYLSRTVKTS